MPRKDDSLDKGYLDILDDIVVGHRRYDSLWLHWFSKTSKTTKFENRIRAVFDERGGLPSATQFFRAKTMVTDEERGAVAAIENQRQAEAVEQERKEAAEKATEQE